MTVEILYFEGCPYDQRVLSRVQALVAEIGAGAEIELVPPAITPGQTAATSGTGLAPPAHEPCGALDDAEERSDGYSAARRARG